MVSNKPMFSILAQDVLDPLAEQPVQFDMSITQAEGKVHL